MNPHPIKKMSWLLAAVAILSTSPFLVPDGSFREISENTFIKTLREKLNRFSSQFSQERLYLQFDKTLYEPGDDIWFSAYLREGELLKPSQQSDVVHVELIGPKGNTEKKISLVAKNGKVSGDFSIGPEAPGGLYKIKAYTNWMKNENPDNCFEKELQVQEVLLPNLKMKLEFERKAYGSSDEVVANLEVNSNENKALGNLALKFTAQLAGQKIAEQTLISDNDGMQRIKFRLPENLKSNDGLLNVMIEYNGNTESISRSIPIVLNKINLELFPEGGDLVYGLQNKIAFRALNEFGKPADVEGIITTEKGIRLGSFSSYHQGMGAFDITPQPGERYFIKITKPKGVKEEFRVPEPLERGYLLQADNSLPDEIKILINSTETEELALVANIRGKIYYSTVLNTLPGTTAFSFSTKNMPAGVCQLTLFDSRGIARAERLCFVNRDKQLNISITTDKEKYLPREKVKMTLSVRDERGLPTPANLSMAVVNDQLLSFADDKSGNLVSQLLLEQDLKTKVEEPAFYFNKKEAKSAKALDYLLLTSGWRRFTWEKLIEDEVPVISFPAQKAIVSGWVKDAATNKTLPGARIKLSTGQEYTADNAGKFALQNLDLSQETSLTISADNYMPETFFVNDYGQLPDVHLYSQNYRQPNTVVAEQLGDMDVIAFVNEDKVQEIQALNAKKIERLDKPQRVNKKSKEMNSQLQRELARAEVANKKNAAMAKEVKAVLANFEHEPNADDADREQGEMPLDRRKIKPDLGNKFLPKQAQVLKYYRARCFAAPVYSTQQTVETRSDFRNTLYWNPEIEIGFSGRKTIEFYASDDITSFSAIAEGIGNFGLAGHTEQKFYTQLPFELKTKIPAEVIVADVISIPLTLKNNSNGPIGGLLTINPPKGFKELNKTPQVQTIMPGKAHTIFLDYQIEGSACEANFEVSFKSCGLNDATIQKIKISPRGFPVQASFSGQDKEKEFNFEMDHLVNGSLKATLCAYPNVVSDLMKGVEGILQEPYGCFEQTSCTAYPNAMVLDYLKNTGNNNTKVLARATDLLDRGYKRLTTFETPNKGYEWFGANPAHEGLTAYGIMEFIDMKKAGQQIDEEMLERTAKWLLNHRDGKGGFTREKRALHDFGRISDEVLNAYIVYALAEAGYSEIKKEFETAYSAALSGKDPYLLAMVTNAAFALKENSMGNKSLSALLALQQEDGSFNGTTHSITYSQGNSLTIETTALAIMAMLKAEHKNGNAINNAVNFLVSTRSGSGVFSSTQGTILALKCLTEYAKYSKKTNENGTIAVYINGKRVAEKKYQAGETGEISLTGLEGFIKNEGKHRIKIKFEGCDNALPYSLSVNWNTSLPSSHDSCKIDLKTTLSSTNAVVGETVRLTTQISNKKTQGIPSVVAIIGIPAGLSVQSWQLKELQEKQMFDYYEIKGNKLSVYYRGMAPLEAKTINLDLKAEIPGTFEAAASTAYLYYTNEFKTWTSCDKITLKKSSHQ